MANSRMKLISKILCLGVVLVMALGILCACDKSADNFYNDVDTFMKKDFLAQNRTYGVAYEDEWHKFHYDNTSPKTRDIIVDSEEKFAEVFNSFPSNVDFEKEMIVVHMFTVINCRPALLNKIVLENGNLQVYFRIQDARPDINDTTMPGQKAIAVKIKKTDIDSIEFIQQ